MPSKRISYGLYFIGICVLLLSLADKPFHKVEAQSNGSDITTVAWSPDESLLALGTRHGVVRIIDGASQQMLNEWAVYSSSVAELAWHPLNNKLVIGGYYDTEVKILDIDTESLQSMASLPNPSPIFAARWSPDGNTILIIQQAGDSNFTVWDSQTSQIIHSARVGTGTDIEWSDDRSKFAIPYFAPYIEIRDATTFELTNFVGQSPEEISRETPNNTHFVQWSPDGKYLISGAIAGEVTIWDVETGEAVYELSAPLTTDQDAQQLYAREVWFSPDGLTFSSLAVDGTYRTWETAMGRQLRVTQLNDEIRIAAISPNRTKLAYVGPSNNLILKTFPTANAGPDQTLTDSDGNGMEPVSLDGTASTDSEGSIVSYDWQLDDATIATGPRPRIELPVGEHRITLLVTDNDGLIDTDEVVITIEPELLYTDSDWIWEETDGIPQ